MKAKKIFFNRSNKGSVLAEAALTLPVLVGITLFIIEFGNAIYISNSLNQIARTAARYAAVTPSYTSSQVVDASGASSLLKDPSKLTLTITPAPGSARTVGTVITINAQYNYTPIINPFKILGSSQSWAPTLKSSSVARAEVANAS